MQEKEKIVKKVSIIGIILNFVLLCLKLFIGIISKSQAMIADGINSAGDIFASFMSYIGARLSSKPKDDDHPYGHGKAEYLFSEFISISMIIAAFVMIENSISSIIQKERLSFSIWLIIICIITILTKFLLYIYTRMQYKKQSSILIKASMEDHRNDMILTLGTLIGIICSACGLYFIDGVIGSLISLWIGFVGFKLFKDSYIVLMDTNITKDEQDKIIQMADKYTDILHVDSIASKPIGNSYIIILKISMQGEQTLNYCHTISGKLKEDIINGFEYVNDVIIHINPH